MSILILKLLLAPALVVASSLAGRRWGPTVAGTLVTLPIVAGPILLITGLEHGPEFAARAAGASLLGLVSLALFTVVFAALSRMPRTGHWAVTLVLAWAVCLVADLALAPLSVPPVGALCLSLAATACGTWALTRTAPADAPIRPSAPLPWWDLPARAAATAALVTALTTAAAQLGPDLTGVLAPFPIGTSVVATFALAQGGTAAAAATLRGILRGLWGFAAFCFLAAVLIEPLGTGPAFAVALAGTLTLQPALGRLQTALAARRAPDDARA
ncbi:hypothetical protein [Streptomyces exfoliatus]|uniref:hypothetical protein n=1 Tax=Streptomyces exfoliatus TaxID=1905 RepID=UPI000A6110B4|nr:hypothetical protein [Streptomyces exfoliatus]